MPIGLSHLTPKWIKNKKNKKRYREGVLNIFDTIEWDVKNRKNDLLTFSKVFTKPFCYVSSASLFFLIPQSL